MSIFDVVDFHEHEQVVYCYDKTTGLKAIIAIHDTTLGPALGGTRLLPYETEEEALRDVLRLSRGMSYKSACAGLHLGGGKAVIIADPSQKSEAFFRAYGRFVESLNGRYITAEDMNITVKDIDRVRLETTYVAGVSPELGGSGDPGVFTALGTYYGIKASLQHALQKTNLHGIKVAVQGVGSVGRKLCELLFNEGAILFVQDINEAHALQMKEKFGATVVNEKQIYDLDVDVYAPCARGATLNSNTIPRLKASIIAGCANNQLEREDEHGNMIKERGILYAPDYVINAGGIINVANELSGYNRQKVEAEVVNIVNTLKIIFENAKKENINTQQATDLFAKNRIKSIRQLKTLTTKKTSFFNTL